jgi:hypothetical protein
MSCLQIPKVSLHTRILVQILTTEHGSDDHTHQQYTVSVQNFFHCVSDCNLKLRLDSKREYSKKMSTLFCCRLILLHPPCPSAKPKKKDLQRGTWWPQQLVAPESEVSRTSKSANERGPSLFGSLGLSWRYKSFSFRLGCSNQPSTKYFFPRRTLFQFLCPHQPAIWADSLAG